MASISNNNGKRLIQFVDAAGIRRTVRLGDCNSNTAIAIRIHIETLLAAKLSGQPVPAGTAAWLSTVGDTLYGRLAAVGLVLPREAKAKATLAALLQQFRDTVLPQTKPATQAFYGHTLQNLTEFFGEAKPVADITAADADAFRAFLIGRKLAMATINRRCVAAKTVFAKAKRWGLTADNVFAELQGGGQANEARKYFVTPDDARRLLEACPDAEWRAIVALSRFGGLRVPSEIDGLMWADVNWEKGTLHVRSPKTEHHAGQASRIVPLFPELRKALMELFESAEPESGPYIIAKHHGHGVNLRTYLERIAIQAGLKPWPKLFHNMRASRQSELMAEYDLSTVCRWLGNSPAVAAQHYAMSTDSDGAFRRAIGEPESALQKALQYTVVTSRNEPQVTDAAMQKSPNLQPVTGAYETSNKQLVGFKSRTQRLMTASWSARYRSRLDLFSYSLPMLYGGEVIMS